MSVLKDPTLERLLETENAAGYRLVAIEPGGEFGMECKTARITGPTMPERGLPFPVPCFNAETWAKRMILSLAIAYRQGEAKAQRAATPPVPHETQDTE
jgi:hypothetical protein